MVPSSSSGEALHWQGMQRLFWVASCFLGLGSFPLRQKYPTTSEAKLNKTIPLGVFPGSVLPGQRRPLQNRTLTVSILKLCKSPTL